MFKMGLGLCLLGLVLVGCGRQNSSSNDESPADTTSEIRKGFHEETVTVQGTSRDYILYVPESYTGSSSVPLLFSFHGFGGDMRDNFDSVKFHEIADANGFILVHPRGTVGSNGKRFWNITGQVGVYDLDFFDSMLSKVTGEFSIDTTKVYSTGISNGAYFSFVLACLRQDKIAAIAPVAGGMTSWTTDNCSHSEPVPVLEIHGDADRIVDYDNNVPDALEFWVDRNGTATNATVTIIKDTANGDPAKVEQYIYGNGTDGSIVKHLKIIGGGHRWPGSGNNDDLETSQIVWDFVNDFSL